MSKNKKTRTNNSVKKNREEQLSEIYNLNFILKTFVLFILTTCVISFITFTSLWIIKDWWTGTQLNIKTNSENPEIKFLNPEKAFSQGMKIDPGKYDLEVCGREKHRRYTKTSHHARKHRRAHQKGLPIAEGKVLFRLLPFLQSYKAS